ncbi:MAG: hypothetical protein U5M23_00715 [Marinagarivorans sp.]|nr:hypothetical protein [Marinagarivorans sp.]
MRAYSVTKINKANATQSAPSFKRHSLMLAVGLATLMLASCGSGSGKQDQGSAATFNQEFSGVAVDGHIARATVFIDSNNNGTRDPWEPYAFTDNEGYFGRNPNTGVNYCAGDANAEDTQYCLNSSSRHNHIVLRIDGGYDRLTGEPFLAQLSRRINADNPADTVNTVISPITTLVTAMENNKDQQAVLTALGMNAADLDVDYLNAQGNTEINSWLFNNALKIHKTITVLSDRIDDNYPDINSETSMPNGTSLWVYRSLAEQLTKPAQQLDSVLTDSTQLVSILDNAEEKVRALYQHHNFEIPADMGSSSNPDRFARVAAIATDIPKIIDRLINMSDIAMDQGQILGNVRALEALVIKTTQESPQIDNTLDNAFRFFLNNNNDSLLEALRLALSDDNANVSNLALSNFNDSDFSSTQAIDAIARLTSNATPFGNLGGKMLKVSDLDLGFSPDGLKDIEIELNFLGDKNAVNGGFIACAKYIEDASKQDLGEGNFNGELINGYWSLLGANSEKASAYSLLLTFEFLGAKYQAIMKPAGEETINGIKYQQIRFDNNGDIRVWHSANGFTTQAELPTNSADCKTRLPSRVGL